MHSETFGSLYSGLSDFDLVLACQQKIEAAFNALYKRHLRYVRGVLNQLAPDLAQNHDDIVQEIFVRVWKSIGNLRNPGAFKTWLNRLIKNLFFDELRKRPKDFVLSIDEPLKGANDDDDGACMQIADIGPRPDEVFERNEIILHVKEALELLPEHSKNVIILREFYGISYEEIAHRTKTQLGTVKSRIARARLKMQSQLEQLNCA